MTLHNSKSKDKGFHVLSHIVCLDIRLNNISICHCFKMLQIFKKNCVLHIFNESGFFPCILITFFSPSTMAKYSPSPHLPNFVFPFNPPPKKNH